MIKAKRLLFALLVMAAAAPTMAQESKNTVLAISFRWPLVDGVSGSGYQLELGFRLAPEKPVFAIAGLEYAYSNAKISYGNTNTVYSTSLLNVPLTLGYRIGNPEKFDIFLQGGVRYGYVLSAKMGSNSVLDGMDRSGFGGLARVSVGYASIRFFGEYGFPFGDGDGVWSIGVVFGFSDKASLF